MALLVPRCPARPQVAQERALSRNFDRKFNGKFVTGNSRCTATPAATMALALRAHRERRISPTHSAAPGTNRRAQCQAGTPSPKPVRTQAVCPVISAALCHTSGASNTSSVTLFKGVTVQAHRPQWCHCTGRPSRGGCPPVRAQGGGSSFIGRPWSGNTQQQQQQQQWSSGQQAPPPQAQGQPQTLPGGLQVEQLMTLESNIDDMSPQLLAFTCEKLLEAGALDVWTTAAIMKKGRHGMILHVLCSQEAVNNMLTVIFYETTSLGVRIMPCDRVSVQRVVESVSTQWGFIPVKAAFIHGQLVTATAEYENCAEVARQQNVPLKVVKSAAEEAYIQSEMRERQSLSP